MFSPVSTRKRQLGPDVRASTDHTVVLHCGFNCVSVIIQLTAMQPLSPCSDFGLLFKKALGITAQWTDIRNRSIIELLWQ